MPNKTHKESDGVYATVPAYLWELLTPAVRAEIVAKVEEYAILLTALRVAETVSQNNKVKNKLPNYKQ